MALSQQLDVALMRNPIHALHYSPADLDGMVGDHPPEGIANGLGMVPTPAIRATLADSRRL